MEDYDSTELLQTLDYILTSEDPNIKRLLRNLLLVAALQDKDDELDAGPIQKELSSLHRRIDQLENRMNGSGNIAWPNTTTFPANITWTDTTADSNVSTFDLVSDSLATLNDIKIKDEIN